MASITVDLPEPVGPLSANRSTPEKSISVGSRNTPKPATSSRSGRIDDLPHRVTRRTGRARRLRRGAGAGAGGLVEQLVEESEQSGILDAALIEVGGEELVGRATVSLLA